MNLTPFILLVALPIADMKRAEPVDFEKEVLPILKNNCLACHNQTKAKAGLILETPQSILKGGDSGPGSPGNRRKACS
jgi:cytochrome c